MQSVLVYRLICDNTVDEQILIRLNNKQKLFDEFADKSKSGNESLLKKAWLENKENNE